MPIIFNPITLEIDPALWGGFWQGDVISAGYTLPALELAFLRESRLACATAATSPAEYFAQLQNSLTQKPMGLWQTTIANHKLCCAAVPKASQWQIIWYAKNVIFAGYASPPIISPGYNLHPTQLPAIEKTTAPSNPLKTYARQILESLSLWADNWQSSPVATRIDRTLQAHRAYSLLPDERKDIAAWLDAFGK